MRRPKLSNEEREQRLRSLDKQIALKARRKKLYNKRFRKSSLFISAWSVRLLYISFFMIVVYLQTKSSGMDEEIVSEKYIGRHVESSKLSTDTTMAFSTLYISTNRGDYSADISGLHIPGFDVGDTLQIHRNLFDKPIYFTKHNWAYKYELSSNLGLYLFVLFLTLISLFFNDGLDRLTKKILWGFMMIDVIIVLVYFFI